MRVSKLYSNRPDIFTSVDFRVGINAIIAEIRLAANRDKDTHNLGKTTLGRLLDFCLLQGRDAKFFLFKHLDRFEDFIFFLEVELPDSSYLTIRRSVAEASKVSFKKHEASHQDFSDLSDASWDHSQLPFDRAREMLDALLDWRALSPYGYRKIVGYLIRSQDDFRDVFHLRKFASAHSDWKPFLASMLGFNSIAVEQLYAIEKSLSEKESTVDTVRKELGGSIEDISKIEGILLLKHREAEQKQNLLDAFDFRSHDKVSTKVLVDEVDAAIARLNAERYSLSQNRKKVLASLEDDQILMSPEEVQRVFSEAGVLFPQQLKRDFQQLIAFNQAITDERRQYLLEEKAEIDAELKRINTELTALGRRRSEMLRFLTDTDVFVKYRQVSAELVTLRADIAMLERQRGFVHRLQELRSEIRMLREERGHLQSNVEADVEEKNANPESRFSAIRVFFNEVVEEVIDRKALLSVSSNQQGHLDFKADILDEAGNTTSAGIGHTYRKLLCIAFDLAVLRVHLDERFPRFSFHDGIFESLDDRKKENLVGVLRRYADLGVQPIVTLIDSDLPPAKVGESPLFDDEEVVLLLHDESEEGRLFRMAPW